MDKQQDTTKILNNYDWLRVVSAFMVVVIHVNARFLIRNDAAMIHSGMTYYIELLLNIITRFSVPCFVMLSGAFLLNKEENADFKLFYKKSFFKIVVPYLIMTGIWLVYLFLKLESVNVSSLKEYAKLIVRVDYGSFWYMPMLIILYLLTPILIRLKKSTTIKQFTVISLLFMVWAVISQAMSSYKAPYVSGVVISYMGYFMLGNVMHNIQVSNKRKHMVLSLVGIAAAIALTMFVRLKGYMFYQYDAYRAFFSPTIVVYSLLVFWVFHNMDIKYNIRTLSNATYYIYLFHTFVLANIMSWYGIDLCGREIVSLIVLSLAVFIISALAALFILFFQKQRIGRNRKYE